MSQQERDAPGTSTEDLGAAQFVTKLNDDQLQHLQFSIPNKHDAERLSRFLEQPRRVPVPTRFTFAPVEPSSPGKHARTESDKSVKSISSGKHSRTESNKSAKPAGKHSRADSTWSIRTFGIGKHSRSNSEKSTSSRYGSEGSTVSRISGDLLREVEKVASVDWRFYTTGACLCVVNLVAAWDTTTLPIALPTIATALGASSFETFWLALCYLATATCVIPVFRIFSDIFGRKAILLAALFFFGLGSLIAAITGRFYGLLIGRTIQGIGAGGIWPLSNLIVSDLVSTADRKRWSTFLGAAWAIGAVTGPLLGAVLADNGKWRWIFWINLPFSVFTFLVLAIFARLTPAAPGTILSKLRTVDWVGFIVFSGSLVSLLLAITWAGTIRDWVSVPTIMCILIGVFGLLIYVAWSWWGLYPSLISFEGFFNPTKFSVYFGAMIQGLVVSAALHFLPLYFCVSKRSQSLVEIALALCAWSISLTISAAAAFFLVTKTTIHRPLTWAAWFLVVLGFSLMAILTRDSGTAKWLCIALASGFGVGALYPTISTLAYFTHQIEYKDDAVTNLAFFQSLGQALGVALGSSILQNQLLRELRKHPVLHGYALRYAKNAFVLISIVRQVSSSGDVLKLQVGDMYVSSIRVVWVVMAALAAVAMVASLLISAHEVMLLKVSRVRIPEASQRQNEAGDRNEGHIV